MNEVEGDPRETKENPESAAEPPKKNDEGPSSQTQNGTHPVPALAERPEARKARHMATLVGTMVSSLITVLTLVILIPSVFANGSLLPVYIGLIWALLVWPFQLTVTGHVLEKGEAVDGAFQLRDGDHGPFSALSFVAGLISGVVSIPVALFVFQAGEKLSIGLIFVTILLSVGGSFFLGAKAAVWLCLKLLQSWLSGSVEAKGDAT